MSYSCLFGVLKTFPGSEVVSTGKPGTYIGPSHCDVDSQPEIRSGQVRSVCLTCTFRASCCSARFSRAHVPAFTVPLSGTRKKKVGRE